MDEREKRDAEINAALKGIESLINPSDAPITTTTTTTTVSDDEIDELVALVGDVKVKQKMNINDRIDFAAQIEEIESKGFLIIHHHLFNDHNNKSDR